MAKKKKASNNPKSDVKKATASVEKAYDKLLPYVGYKRLENILADFTYNTSVGEELGTAEGKVNYDKHRVAYLKALADRVESTDTTDLKVLSDKLSFSNAGDKMKALRNIDFNKADLDSINKYFPESYDAYNLRFARPFVKKRDGGQVMKKQVGNLFGSGGPYGAADVYGAGNFYRNGGKIDKKQLAMRLLPMLMGMPSMEEGGYYDQSSELAALADSINSYGPIVNEVMESPFSGKKNKKKEVTKKDAVTTKDIMKEIEKKNDANMPATPEELKKAKEQLIMLEQATNYAGDNSLPAGALGTLMLPSNRYGGLTEVYGDLPEYEYGGLPVEGETNAEARNRQGRQSVAGQTLGGAGTGAATGAAIGSAIVPGLGTAIGAGAGAIIGGVSGFFKGKRDKREAEEYDAEMVAQQNRLDQEARSAEIEKAAQNEYNTYLNDQQSALAGADLATDQTGYGVDMMRKGGLVGAPQFEVEGGEIYQGGGIQQVYGQGELKSNSNNSMKIEGPQHEQGGVKMESSEGGRIFSDKLKPKGEKETFAALADVYTKQLGKIEDTAKGGDTAAQNTAKYMKQGIESKLDELFNAQEELKAKREESKAKREAKKMEAEMPEYSVGGMAAASFGPALINPLYNIGKGVFSKLEYATAEEVDAADYSDMLAQQRRAQSDAAAAYKDMEMEASKTETYNPAAEMATARETAARTRYDMQKATGGNLRALMSANMAAQRAQTGMEGSVLGKAQQMDIAARQAARDKVLGVKGQAAQQQYAAQSALAQIMGQQSQADQQAALYNAQVREKNQLYRLQAQAARDAYLDAGIAGLGQGIYTGMGTFQDMKSLA